MKINIKENNCDYVLVDVFAYNDIGKNFYVNRDYHTRMETMIKKL